MMQDRSQCSRVVVRFCSVEFLGQINAGESLLASVRTLFLDNDVPASSATRPLAVSEHQPISACFEGPDLPRNGELPVLFVQFLQLQLPNPLGPQRGDLFLDLSTLGPNQTLPFVRCRPITDGEAFSAFHVFAKLRLEDAVVHMQLLLCYGPDSPSTFEEVDELEHPLVEPPDPPVLSPGAFSPRAAFNASAFFGSKGMLNGTDGHGHGSLQDTSFETDTTSTTNGLGSNGDRFPRISDIKDATIGSSKESYNRRSRSSSSPPPILDHGFNPGLPRPRSEDAEAIGGPPITAEEAWTQSVIQSVFDDIRIQRLSQAVLLAHRPLEALLAVPTYERRTHRSESSGSYREFRLPDTVITPEPRRVHSANWDPEWTPSRSPSPPLPYARLFSSDEKGHSRRRSLPTPNPLPKPSDAALPARVGMRYLLRCSQSGFPRSLVQSGVYHDCNALKVRVEEPLIVTEGLSAPLAFYCVRSYPYNRRKRGDMSYMDLSGGVNGLVDDTVVTYPAPTRQSWHRFSDFETLHRETIAAFAFRLGLPQRQGDALAPLPPKSWRSHLPSSLNSSFLESRRAALQLFIQTRVAMVVRYLARRKRFPRDSEQGRELEKLSYLEAVSSVLRFLDAEDLSFAYSVPSIPKAFLSNCAPQVSMYTDTSAFFWLWVSGAIRRLRQTYHADVEYRVLCEADASLSVQLGGKISEASAAFTQIELDIQRTAARGAPERAALGRVLRAFALSRPRVGYCQAMNFVALFLLRELAGAQSSFVSRRSESWWTDGLPEDVLKAVEPLCYELMVCLATDVLPDHWVPSMVGVQVDMRLLKTLLQLLHPDVAQTLAAIGLPLEFFASQWMLTLFSTCLPRNVSLRVMDLVFAVGSDALVFISLVLLVKAVKNGHVTAESDPASAAADARHAVATFLNADELIAEAEAARLSCATAKPGLQELRNLHDAHVLERSAIRLRLSAVRNLSSSIRSYVDHTVQLRIFHDFLRACRKNLRIHRTRILTAPDFCSELERVLKRARYPFGAVADTNTAFDAPEPLSADRLQEVFDSYESVLGTSGLVRVEEFVIGWALMTGTTIDERLELLFCSCSLGTSEDELDVRLLPTLFHHVLNMLASESSKDSVAEQVNAIMHKVTPSMTIMGLSAFKDFCKSSMALRRTLQANLPSRR